MLLDPCWISVPLFPKDTGQTLGGVASCPKCKKNAQKQKHPLITLWCVPFRVFSCALSLQIISCLIIKLHEVHLNGFIIFDYIGITQFTEPYSNC